MTRFALIGLAALAVATPAWAGRGMYSYYPSDAATRELADNGFTLLFDKALLGGVRLRKLMSTEAPVSADLEPADDRELGVPLRSLIGDSGADDLYRIGQADQGPAMVRAFCPGSTKGWLAFGPVKVRRNLEIQVLGDDPKSGKARRCATLELTYRGDWNPRPPGFRPPPAF
jgi:hypothetical protein